VATVARFVMRRRCVDWYYLSKRSRISGQGVYLILHNVTALFVPVAVGPVAVSPVAKLYLLFLADRLCLF
jgi:hypothetical protein